MDSNRYRAFVAAVENNTMSAAAKQLGYTPSGIIRLINALEEELGFPVLDRTSTGVTPTLEGERLYPIFKEMTHLQQQVEDTSQRIRGLAEGTLTIGSLSSLASFWLPTVIKEYQKRFPNIKVNIIGGSNARQFQLLEDFKVDCCLCHKGDKRFPWVSLGEQEVVVWVPKDSPLIKHGEVLMAELDGQPFIMTNPDDDSLFDNLMYRKGIEPDIRFTTSSWHATFSMVQAGLGMSVCAKGIATRWHENNVVELPFSPKRYLEFGIATYPGSTPSPALEEFIRVAKLFTNQWPLS